MAGPYKAEARPGYWILIDTRTNEPASFPTTKSNCQREAAFMNRTYREAVAALPGQLEEFRADMKSAQLAGDRRGYEEARKLADETLAQIESLKKNR